MIVHPWRRDFITKAERRKGHVTKTKAKNVAKALAYGRKYRGLPEATRPSPETCECCGGPPGKHAMCLDHDHTTGKFRGWLCGKCNSAIGKLGDSISGVQRALDYLTRTSVE